MKKMKKKNAMARSEDDATNNIFLNGRKNRDEKDGSG